MNIPAQMGVRKWGEGPAREMAAQGQPARGEQLTGVRTPVYIRPLQWSAVWSDFLMLWHSGLFVVGYGTNT